MSVLYDERAASPTKTPPTTERASELRIIARKAVDASLELADELETAQDEAEVEGSQVIGRTPRKWAVTPTFSTLPPRSLSAAFLANNPLVSLIMITAHPETKKRREGVAPPRPALSMTPRCPNGA